MAITLKEGILFLVAVVDITLAALIILHNPRKLVSWIFATVPVGTAVWAIGLAMLSFAPESLVWGKAVFGASFLIFPLLVIFSDVFPDKTKLEWWHFFFLLPGLALLIFAPADLLLGSQFIHNYQITQSVVPFYSLYNLYILVCLAWTTLNLLRKYRSAVAITRLQIYYLFFGFVIFAFFVSLANLFLPFLQAQELVMLGPASSLVFVTFATYAILRYRLMDIRVAIQRGAVIVGLVAVAPPLFFTTHQALLHFAPGDASWLSPSEQQLILLFAGFISFLILFICGTPLIHFFMNFTERFFFRGTYFYPDIVKRLKAVLDQARSIEDLCVNLTEVLVITFGSDKAVFVLKDKLGRSFSPAYMRGIGEASAFTFDSTDELINYAKRKEGVFLTGEIKADTPAKKEVLERLGRLGVALIIPVETRRGLQGLIFLGGKISGDPYTTRDINLFRIVSELAGIALENIWLYVSLIKEPGSKSNER